jgi:hypothetical protein
MGDPAMKGTQVKRILDYLSRHALAAAAFVCSILALAGSSYAAFTISGSQIRNQTIDPTKFDPKFINGSVRAWAVVDAAGHVSAGAGGPQVFSFGIPGLWGIRWRVRLPVKRCETTATIDYLTSPATEQLPLKGTTIPFAAGFAVASTHVVPPKFHQSEPTMVQTFNQSGQPTPLGFDIAVIC